MANTVLTLAHLSHALLRMMAQGLGPLGKAEYVESPLAGYRIGGTIRLREATRLDPWSFDFVPDPLLQIHYTVVLNHQPRAGFAYSQRDLVLSIDQFGMRHLVDVATALVHQVEALWPPGATLITSSLEAPPAVEEVQRDIDPDSGLSIRCMTMYDPISDMYQFRADMLCGFTNVPQPQYLPSPAETEMITLLLEAKAELTAQLETFKKAA